MGELALADIERAIRDRSPLLGEILVRYLDEPDPDPGTPEIPLTDEGDDAPAPEIPDGAWTRDQLASVVSDAGLRGKNATERKLTRREAFAAAATSPYAPPRLQLGAVLIAAYETGDDAVREALAHAFRHGRLGWGAWQAAKAIYKLAEARHDAAMFGVLACRFDTIGVADTRNEVSVGTLIYLYRRAWRYLRQLGRAVPDLYPAFAVEVLRHYPAGHRGSTWVAGHIFAHAEMTSGHGFYAPTSDAQMRHRAFPDAWKLSPAPLLRLLDLAANDDVCAFAIRALKLDHPLALRAVEPAWLARLGARPIPALHGFVVGLIKDNPELHPSRLAAAGLHDTVIGFLGSDDDAARAFALDYARAHAPDLPVERLIELLDAHKTVIAFAASRLEALIPTLPLAMLLKLVAYDATRAAAVTQLKATFKPADLSPEQFVDLIVAGEATRKVALAYFGDAKAIIPAGHWRAVADDDRRDWRTLRLAMTELGKRAASEIGVPWIQKSLLHAELGEHVTAWLNAGMLGGADLDVEWVKGLVARPRFRATALRILGDRALVEPARLGVAWLLDLTRSVDPTLQGFAQGLLLQGFKPADFAGDGMSGLDRLWDLASGRTRKEPVRQFASTYLRAHHPDIGPDRAGVPSVGIKPALTHADYPLTRIRPLLDDERADVRRLGVAIAREEIVRWGEIDVLYALAGSRHREVRNLGVELLLAAGTPDGVPAEWIDGRRLFVLAESPHKASRETALTVIRKAYDRVGSPERLAWLMESPERDVRLFAVRLFWANHKPDPQRARPAFDDVDALRTFLRTVLYGLPPGRVERRGGPVGVGAALPERPLAASVGKRRLVEAIRDLGVQQAGFARIVAPVLAEFTASEAKGEWQACVAALAAMRAAHGPNLAQEIRA